MPSPRDVAKQYKWGIDECLLFCADLMAEVNSHAISNALKAIQAGDDTLALEFLALDRAITSQGELTPQLANWDKVLQERLAIRIGMDWNGMEWKDINPNLNPWYPNS